MTLKQLLVSALLILAVVTPRISAAQGQTATSSGSVVELQVGSQHVVVNLVSNATDLAGINVNGVEMGTLIGVESSDPGGRYLNAVSILPKRDNATLTFSLLQTAKTDGYRLQQIGDANVAPFWTTFAGTTTPDQLHTTLASLFPQAKGLNLLLSVTRPAQVDIFLTPLPNTVLVVPATLLANQQNLPPSLSVPDLAAMQIADLSRSPYDILDKVRTIPAPALVNISTSKFGVNDSLALATAPLGYKFQTTVVSCPDHLGAVINQKPTPGSNINLFSDTITLTVCEPFLRVTGTVTVNTFLRSIPVLAPGTNILNLPPNAPITITGRTANNAWLLMQLPDGGQGWVSAPSVQLQGDINAITIVDIPSGSFLADVTQISAGRCATLSWNIDNAATVFYKGGPVSASGSNLECPLQSLTYDLQVVAHDGQRYDIPLTIQVIRQGY